MTGGLSCRQLSTSRSVSIQVPLPLLALLGDVRQAFHGLCISTGMQVLQAMQEADRDVLCGPKGRHQSERTAWRGGSVESHVTLGGRQVGLPRLRGNGLWSAWPARWRTSIPAPRHPSARGLDETLTVLRLGLTGPLQRTLRTTNIIENLNGGVERYTRNVKRWRGGQMIQLGGECATGSGTALPEGSRLPRHAPSRRCPR